MYLYNELKVLIRTGQNIGSTSTLTHAVLLFIHLQMMKYMIYFTKHTTAPVYHGTNV